MGLCENLSKAQAEEMLPQVRTWSTLAQRPAAGTVCDSSLQPNMAWCGRQQAVEQVNGWAGHPYNITWPAAPPDCSV